MTSFKLTGTKQVQLEAAEIAVILDALSTRPYNQVAGLITKIVEQVRDLPENPLMEAISG